jgi:hypothetical protein
MIIFMAGTLTAFSLFIMYLLPNIWVILIMLIPASFLPFVIALLKSHKVRFGSDYIETTYLLGTKRIDLNEVKKYGIFVSSRYEGIKLTSEYNMGEVDDDQLLFHHIYLTTNEEFDLSNFRTKKHIRFPYRKEFFQLVKAKMVNYERKNGIQQNV